MQDRANGSATSYSYDSLKRLASTTTTKFPTVANASFESMTIPYWTGTAQISSNAEHGLYSVQLEQIQQNFNCSGSCGTPTTYTVSGYMLAGGSSSSLEVTVVGNTTAGTSQYAPAGQIFYTSSASTWAPFSYSFTTPSNLTGGLFVSLTSVAGPVYLDNITVAVQNGPNLISNGDFELGATPNGWGGGASYCGSAVHSGECGVVLAGRAPSNAISQTLSGLSPSTSYNVGVWFNLGSGYTLTLTAGSTPVQSTSSGSWQFLYGTWTSNSNGNLAISISVNANGYAYLDDVTISGGPASPTVTQSEAFGFDGFGNLLSQTPTVGSGPMMSLTADHNSNRLTGQGNYDGAGNFLGNSQYSYDILNRLSATGQYTYTYSPGSNKRMAVYWSSGTSAGASFNIYDPNGRKMGVYNYTATAPWSNGAQFQPGLSKDIWYLGSKRIDISEDQVGSNWDQAQYYPWGQVQAGQQPSETQGFGTYVLDTGSGLYYADQRYYNQNWGRFLTADPSNNAISLGSPITWNRYAYGNGDPINLSDPSGLDATCGPGMTWNGEGCMIGSSGISNSGPGPVSLSGGTGLSQDLQQAYNNYADGMAFNFPLFWTPPNPSCVQAAITSAATDAGLDLSIFTTATVQVVNLLDDYGNPYTETELVLDGADSQDMVGFDKTLCNLGFSSNNQCTANNTKLVGPPHPNYSGNYRAPGLTNSVQVNTNQTGAQIDVDTFNPAAGWGLGAVLHALGQWLPNQVIGTDNAYGCGP